MEHYESPLPINRSSPDIIDLKFNTALYVVCYFSEGKNDLDIHLDSGFDSSASERRKHLSFAELSNPESR